MRRGRGGRMRRGGGRMRREAGAILQGELFCRNSKSSALSSTHSRQCRSASPSSIRRSKPQCASTSDTTARQFRSPETVRVTLTCAARQGHTAAPSLAAMRGHQASSAIHQQVISHHHPSISRSSAIITHEQVISHHHPSTCPCAPASSKSRRRPHAAPQPARSPSRDPEGVRIEIPPPHAQADGCRARWGRRGTSHARVAQGRGWRPAYGARGRRACRSQVGIPWLVGWDPDSQGSREVGIPRGAGIP